MKRDRYVERLKGGIKHQEIQNKYLQQKIDKVIKHIEYTNNKYFKEPFGIDNIFDVQILEILQNEEKDVKTMNSETFIERSKEIVRDYAYSHLDVTDMVGNFDVYVVWYNYTLGNSKALISTSLLDGMYYEVTYNKDKDEIYLDAYKKFENKVYKNDD